MFDAGILTIHKLENISEKGRTPVYRLQPHISQHFYEERTVGVTRYYAAQKANVSVDKLVRIWRDGNVTAGDICVLEDKLQYRVGQIQQTYDDDGLAVTDLSLERLERNYDAAENV